MFFFVQVRTRSKTTESAEELHKGWVRDKVVEQKKTLLQKEEELGDMEKKIKMLEVRTYEALL